MKKLGLLLGMAAMVFAGLGSAQGQTIISFAENGSGVTVPYPVNFISDSLSGITLTADSNLDTATLSLGSGAQAGTAAASLGFADAGDFTTLSAAITGNQYHSILLTPSSGYELNISGLTFNADASSGTSTFNFFVLSSVTGFTSADSLGTFSIVNGANVTTTIDTSGFTDLQGVESSVELRIYVTRTAGAGTAAYYADDGVNSGLFSVNGTVAAVPEPSTYALIGLGLTGLVVLRRMKRSSKA